MHFQLILPFEASSTEFQPKPDILLDSPPWWSLNSTFFSSSFVRPLKTFAYSPLEISNNSIGKAKLNMLASFPDSGPTLPHGIDISLVVPN